MAFFPIEYVIVMFLCIFGIVVTISFFIKPFDRICRELDGAIFGPLEFELNHFSWWVSDDYGVGGTYECKSGDIIALPHTYNNGQPIMGKFIPPDTLIWNGGKYARTPGKAMIPVIALSRQRMYIACLIATGFLIFVILVLRRQAFGW